MIFDHPMPCPNCDKPAKKKTEAYYLTTEPYRGNLQILRDKSWHDQSGLKHYNLSLWDGESYTHKCGYFCTNRCAQEYANAVYRAAHGNISDLKE